MEITKKLESEIIQFLDTYWEKYITGDFDTWSTFLMNEYKNIGTNQEEIWHSKKEILDYTLSVADQMIGQVNLKNKTTKVYDLDPYVLTHEFGDMYIKLEDEWVFYAKLRLSSVLQQTDTGWKVLHQHGSFPDAKTEEGEFIAFEDISRENSELRDAIKRRTAELEFKNRELEIETSLEKVRAVALSMHTTDDMLEVCRTICTQLELLNIENIRNVQTAIIYASKGVYLNHEFYRLHDRTFITEVDYTLHQAQSAFVHEILEGPESFHAKLFTKAELKDWIAYQATTTQFVDPHLYVASSLNYYWYSMGPVALGVSTYVPLQQDELNLIRRFRNVFELAHRRFLDVEQAIAQAREAQIEHALEKVRSRSMSMHKSEELVDASVVLFKELSTLGIEAIRTGIGKVNTETASITVWSSQNIKENEIKILGEVPKNAHPFFEAYYKAWENGEKYYSMEIAGEELIAYYHTMSSILSYPQKTIFNPKEYFNAFYFKEGSLNVITSEPIPSQQYDLICRFAGVFGLAYRRFLDLQKAEAQARDAQIEAALEKVRSRSLAMHRSDELKEVVAILFAKLKELQIPATAVGIGISIEGSKDLETYVCGENEDGLVITNYILPYFDNTISKDLYNTLENQLDYFVGQYSKEEKNSFYKYLFEHSAIKDVPDDIKNMIFESSTYTTSMVAVKNAVFNINDFEGNVLAENEVGIIKRFAKVFDQAYIRFMDIKKSEAQAREAEIELALERVRSQAMAMQKSSDLLDIVVTMRNEFTRLGHEAHYFWHMMWLPEKYEKAMTSGDGTRIGMVMELPRHIHGDIPLVDDWEKSKEPLVVFPMDAEAAIAYVDKLIAFGDFQQVDHNAPGHDDIRHIGGLTFVMARTTHGEIGYSLPGVVEYPPKEDLDILVRFAGAFDIAHQRFIDLQKSEAQSREVEIELALEKVRSRSMGMQKSEELTEVIRLVYQQLTHLKIKLDHAGFVVDYTPKGDWHFWIADDVDIPSKITHPYFESVWANQFNEAKEKGADLFATNLDFEEKNKFYSELLSFIPELPEASKEFYLTCPGLAATTVLYDDIALYIENFEGIPYSDQENKIVLRFGKVFQQTYTRFLDLQKAEAQAREGQIQLALERVRSRTMAMHKSDELPETSHILFEQMNELGEPTEQLSIGIVREELNVIEISATLHGDTLKKVYNHSIDEPYMMNKVYKAWKTHQQTLIVELKGEELNAYNQYRNELTHSEMFPTNLGDENRRIVYAAFFSKGMLALGTNESRPPQSLQLLERFASVFDLTYTRFLDLQKAEAQAREAQIETALERVRAQTMAMNKSEDLQQAVAVIFKELDKLDLKTMRCGIGIINEENRTVNVWTTTGTEDGDIVSFSGNESMDVHPVLQGAFASWEKQEDFYYELIGEDLINYYKAMGGDNYKLPDTASGSNVSNTDRHYYYCTFFSAGGLYFFSEFPFTPELARIIRRFANAFSLSYKRFEDLKLSEQQAYKAKIEFALERVRARALAMQAPEELLEVAQVLRHEMGLLGIEELETASIYIHDEDYGKTECWYALKDVREEKSALVSDHFALNLSDTWVGREMIKFYDQETVRTSIVMQGKNRIEWIRYCEENSPPFKGYYGETIPDRTYHLYRFSDGAIGAAAPGDISEESWELLRRASSVFSLAYSRFKDLTQARVDLIQLKTEKQRVEEALSDLKAAQSQLVQAEKMASLGELTAGIAHEIQNPLNFVNNFSDINTELIDELEEEVDKGNLDEVKAIAKDIKENEQKINHHGKRADAIVKGMLQHSRAGSGVKEPTDINALADEYFRLAYHGLRAKDKSFNATLQTDFDPNIGLINVVPQDIGRVLLNLINNAFHAISNPKPTDHLAPKSPDLSAPLPPEGGKIYEPTVTVTTKLLKPPTGGLGATTVEISVTDNGPGIPSHILDKIFQPFFTTKPTGEGTGLGLSLAYDIVKAHGGDIKVISTPGDTCFTITLPQKHISV